MMKTNWISKLIMIFFFLVIIFILPAFAAGETAVEDDQAAFKKEKLAQMLAPIVL